MASSSCASGAVSQRAGVQQMSAAFLEVSGSRHRILTCAADAQAFERRRDEHVSVQVSRHGQFCRLSIFIVCTLLSFLGFCWLLSIVISQWQQQISYRLWLVLGLLSYASILVYRGWGMLVQFGEDTLLMQVTIKSTRTSTLYYAVCEHVASIAACAHGAPISRDMEAGLDYDAVFGRSAVKLRWWGRRGKTVRLKVMDTSGRQKKMLVTQIRNADISTGHDYRQTADECLLLRMWSSDSSLELNASLVQTWLQTCVDEYLKQPKDQIQIYRPKQKWKEGEPEWTPYRTRRAPSASTTVTGPLSYIPRQSLREILVDVTHRHTSLRVYFVHGATGTGKSHFVVWLAGELGMPIYNISLTSPMFQGDSLLALFSETALKHWPCLVHIDEFDAAVEMWLDKDKRNTSGPAYGASLETFKELLDGSGSMTSGIIVITGVNEASLRKLPDEEAQQIQRRLHKVAQLDCFADSELESYVSQFMAFYVNTAVHPHNYSDYLEQFGKAFVRRMNCRAVHAVEKELNAFLTKALLERKMVKRKTAHTKREIDDQCWWNSMYADIRDYYVPVEVLQEYVAVGEDLGDALA